MNLERLTGSLRKFKKNLLEYIDPLTTRGDMVIRDATKTTRLAIGSNNSFLRSDGSDPVWTAFASQSDQENAGSSSVVVTPGQQHFHPGHPKYWGVVSYSVSTPTLDASFNMASITDTGIGILTGTIATDMDGSYVTVSGAFDSAQNAYFTNVEDQQAGTFIIHVYNTGGSLVDPNGIQWIGTGDHA